ncbi:MAG: hypothetical protein ACLS3Y_00255 [Collinsella sp.]
MPSPSGQAMLAVGGLDPCSVPVRSSAWSARGRGRHRRRHHRRHGAREGDQVTVDADKNGGFTVVCDNTPSATYEVPEDK